MSFWMDTNCGTSWSQQIAKLSERCKRAYRIDWVGCCPPFGLVRHRMGVAIALSPGLIT